MSVLFSLFCEDIKQKRLTERERERKRRDIEIGRKRERDKKKGNKREWWRKPKREERQRETVM